MVWYLKRRFSAQAGRIVSELEHGHPRVFDLVKRPFFLKVLRDILNPDDLDDLPSTPATLIRSFIECSISRRLKSGETRQASVAPARFDHCLAVLAERLLSLFTSGKESFLRYPSTLAGLDCGRGTWDEVLQLAESVGVLRNSGLHCGRNDDENRIAFEHDLFRDYFAAVWLLETGSSEGLSNKVDSLMESTVWDTPLKMYCELAGSSCRHVNRVVEQVSVHDPYLATECIAVRDSWEEETIRTVFSNLRKWEMDVPGRQRRPFSNAGLWAAPILLRRLPIEELVSIYDTSPRFSLMFVAAPEVLLGDSHIDRLGIVVHIANVYDEYPYFLLKGLASWNDVAGSELLAMIADGIMSSAQYDPWSDAGGPLMRIVLSTSFRPSFDHAKRLCRTLRAPLMHQLIYFLAKCSREDLNSLATHSYPFVQLVGAFKTSEMLRDDFQHFCDRLSTLGPG